MNVEKTKWNETKRGKASVQLSLIDVRNSGVPLRFPTSSGNGASRSRAAGEWNCGFPWACCGGVASLRSVGLGTPL